MKDELQEHGVQIVAISKDSLEEAAQHKIRDSLGFELLSDPKLEVIRQYGVEHHKGVEFSTLSFTVAGVPLALVPTIQAMAIPTTVLIDEAGVIRWVDQTDDYRLRSNEARVLQAVTQTFG